MSQNSVKCVEIKFGPRSMIRSIGMPKQDKIIIFQKFNNLLIMSTFQRNNFCPLYEIIYGSEYKHVPCGLGRFNWTNQIKAPFWEWEIVHYRLQRHNMEFFSASSLLTLFATMHKLYESKNIVVLFSNLWLMKRFLNPISQRYMLPYPIQLRN